MKGFIIKSEDFPKIFELLNKFQYPLRLVEETAEVIRVLSEAKEIDLPDNGTDKDL
jgi:hypothetical protein